MVCTDTAVGESSRSRKQKHIMVSTFSSTQAHLQVFAYPRSVSPTNTNRYYLQYLPTPTHRLYTAKTPPCIGYGPRPSRKYCIWKDVSITRIGSTTAHSLKSATTQSFNHCIWTRVHTHLRSSSSMYSESTVANIFFVQGSGLCGQHVHAAERMSRHLATNLAFAHGTVPS